MEDDGCSETRSDEVPGEDEVDEELEAGVVEDNVYAAVFLAGFLCSSQDAEGLVKVVDEDVFLRVLARF